VTWDRDVEGSRGPIPRASFIGRERLRRIENEALARLSPAETMSQLRAENDRLLRVIEGYKKIIADIHAEWQRIRPFIEKRFE